MILVCATCCYAAQPGSRLSPRKLGGVWERGGAGIHAERGVRGTPGSTAAETLNAAWGR